LPESDSLIWSGSDQAFFQALKNDIMKILSTISNTNGTDKNEIFEALKKQGKDEKLLQQLKSLLDECDAVAYSPMPIPANRHAILQEAKFLLGKL
jgi:DNA relaxase NicK